ncbi:MAG: hypothetical protein O7D31_02550 [Alphaproteobacteria bacterium]|nr:hypothetical protein [Alphaproteobacteria bacterium]
MATHVPDTEPELACHRSCAPTDRSCMGRLLDTLERVTSESVEQRLEELEAKLAELKAPEFTMLGAVRRPDIKRSTQASGRRTFRA